MSHDEGLIRLLCQELWVSGNKTVKAMGGGIDEYRRLVEKEIQF